jgi:hypothetical protein
MVGTGRLNGYNTSDHDSVDSSSERENFWDVLLRAAIVGGLTWLVLSHFLEK